MTFYQDFFSLISWLLIEIGWWAQINKAELAVSPFLVPLTSPVKMCCTCSTLSCFSIGIPLREEQADHLQGVKSADSIPLSAPSGSASAEESLDWKYGWDISLSYNNQMIFSSGKDVCLNIQQIGVISTSVFLP